MWKPAGTKGSPNHHDVVLANWARLRRIDIGQHCYRGWSLFVWALPPSEGSMAFFVEHRGPPHGPFRKIFPFGDTPGDRRGAFAEARRVFLSMSGKPLDTQVIL